MRTARLAVDMHGSIDVQGASSVCHELDFVTTPEAARLVAASV